MKLAGALLSLVWLTACFPDYKLPTCSDGKRNGDETGVDCGVAACGASATCPDTEGCASDADCDSGNCHASVCSKPCEDGARDKGETGVDCGITACNKTCPAGQGCSADNDCDGGKCANQICEAASCTDGRQNNGETDVDCGGNQGCGRCTTNQRCSAVSDCDGGQCASGQCRAPTCKDSLQNANETDIDCGGGTCLPCGVGKACSKTTDCDGLACTKSVCQPAGCGDGVLNGDETDLDCGGSCATPCADNKHCKAAADCHSGVCPKKTLRCAAPTCDDGVLNGSEPTIDCGGRCSAKCDELDTCSVDLDCAAPTSCIDKRCLPAAATGKKLSTLTWSATASATSGNSDPKNAIDGVASTDWTTGQDQALGMWYVLDMKTEQVFVSIEIDCLRSPLDAAGGINVLLSDDGKTYGDPPAKQDVPTTRATVIKFEKPQTARYIKLVLAENTSTHWWRIDEIRVKQ